MSSQSANKRLTAPDIKNQKGKKPIVSLTAYQAYTARLADRYCDFLLVGDSVGMVVHGLPSTLAVTLDMMIMHGQAVVRGSEHALVVVDMPFSTYEASPEIAFSNAARLVSLTGCGAVKLEGGEKMAPTVRFLTQRGIPVMGHIGLTPQAVNSLGGFKTQGRCESDWQQIKVDALAIEEAGAFAIVVEGVVRSLADAITEACRVPIIGIGASNRCDGQILVMEDMLGYNERVPKFVRRYGELGNAVDEAIKAYAHDVRDRTFPNERETYGN